MADEGRGVLHLLPTFLPEGMVVSAMTAAVSPWMAPAFSGVIGTRQSDGEPAIAVGFEWPTTWLSTADRIPRYDLELLHARRFSTDQTLAAGLPAFGAIAPGGDPPDLVAQTDAGPVGIEATALTIEARREAHALFLDLRRRLMMVEPAALSKLAGHLVYVWFEGPTSQLAQPHRRSDTDAVDSLLHALAAFDPKTDDLWLPSGPLPEQIKPPPATETEHGARFYAVPLLGSVPATVLYTILGFELGLAFTTLITSSDAWLEVQRLVAKHDRPGVDRLLISAAAPNARGVIFPAEEAVRSFLLQSRGGLATPPTHIREVILHSWAVGEAWTIWPTKSHLFGPLYQAFVPVHQPIAVPANSSTTEPGEPPEPTR